MQKYNDMCKKCTLANTFGNAICKDLKETIAQTKITN